MEIICEGKSYTMAAGSTALAVRQAGWGSARSEEAVLAEFEGEVVDLRTPLPGNGTLRWVPLSSRHGYLACQRTLVMLLVSAVHELYGGERDVEVKHSLGDGLYCEFSDGHVPLARELVQLEKRMEAIAAEGRPILPVVISQKEAADFLRKRGRREEADLVERTAFQEFRVYRCGVVMDYFFGPMLPDMGYVRQFALLTYAPGFLLRFPLRGQQEIGTYKEEPLFAKVFLEAEEWGRIAGCRHVMELNRAIRDGRIRDLAAMAEALQEKRLAQLADRIHSARPPVRMVCIAGPSSAGKTTFMRRLLIQLWVNGVHPVTVSLDDFYKERGHEVPGEPVNYENLSALDVELFQSLMEELLEGKTVRLPRFDFKSGTRHWSEELFYLQKGQPVLVEGLHALNPEISRFVPGYQCLHIYLGAMTQLSINGHNRISTTDTRLLRRMVRDARTRGNSAEKTLGLWDTVRRGEEENIFLFQGRAEEIFNTALIYELPVLKKQALPLLMAIGRESLQYAEAQRLLTFLMPFEELDPGLVPDNSILREFIGMRR